MASYLSCVDELLSGKLGFWHLSLQYLEIWRLYTIISDIILHSAAQILSDIMSHSVVQIFSDIISDNVVQKISDIISGRGAYTYHVITLGGGAQWAIT